MDSMTATLNDEPEPALPSTDGEADDPPHYSGKAAAMAGAREGNSEIAAAARQVLAMKTFSPAERTAIINEGEDVEAANLGDLDISGTHYEAMQAIMDDRDKVNPDDLWGGGW